MKRLFVEERSMPLFRAQCNLNGTFRHRCFSLHSDERVPYQLTVERGSQATTFVVEMLGQRHSLTLHKIPKHIDLRLADFVESIANGHIDTGESLPHLARSAAPAERAV